MIRVVARANTHRRDYFASTPIDNFSTHANSKIMDFFQHISKVFEIIKVVDSPCNLAHLPLPTKIDRIHELDGIPPRIQSIQKILSDPQCLHFFVINNASLITYILANSLDFDPYHIDIESSADLIPSTTSSPKGIPLKDILNMGGILIHPHDATVVDPHFTSHDSMHVVESDPSIIDEYASSDKNSWIFDDEEVSTTLDDIIPFLKVLHPPSSIISNPPHELDRIPPHVNSIKQVLSDYQ